MDKRRAKTGLLLALIVLVIDQASKYWVVNMSGIAMLGSIDVAPFLRLVMVWNEGVSFGLFAGSETFRVYGLSGLSFLIVAFLVRWLFTADHRWIAVIGIGLLIGGALGNAIDRLHWGAVADFIDFNLFGLRFFIFNYVFNVADAAISVGVVSLLADSFWPRSELDKAEVRER